VDKYEIYVDGSYMNGATGYGAVILKDGRVVDELCGAVDAAEVNNTRQIAGELIAVREALNWCVKHAINAVSIYYDYLGIEKWATGKWKTNQPLTKDYARFVGECPIKVRWHKVDSHTGDRWNDRADALAKKGAGLGQCTPESTEVAPARGSAGVSPAEPSETNLVSELLNKTEKWIEFLMTRGIEARFDRVYNEQFSRVLVVSQDKTVGIFDLYNTKKKRFSPYVHSFRDKNLKVHIETLWKEFTASRIVS
jgi:ribonuclease HI